MTQDQSPAKAQGVSELTDRFIASILPPLSEREITLVSLAIGYVTARPSEAKPVAVKPLDLANVIRDAFLAGAGMDTASKEAQRIPDDILERLNSYDPEHVPAFHRLEALHRSALYAAPVPAATAQGVTEALRECLTYIRSPLHMTRDDDEEVRRAKVIARAVAALSLPATDTARPLNSEEVEAVRAALIWYENNVAGCRLVHSGGNVHRKALHEDGGKRATDALAALSPAPSTLDGWRDMASAPKDGTEFLAALSNGWIEILSGNEGIRDDWRYSWWTVRGRTSIPYEPTHPADTDWSATSTIRAIGWMPLPTPPAGGL